MYTYKYPHAALTADCVVFGFDGWSLKVLLIQRAKGPYESFWAFPGGFMEMEETTEECARRELCEETGLVVSGLRLFGVFSDVGRDPRERVVSVGYYALAKEVEVEGGDDAAQAQWWEIDRVPPMAFDHRTMLRQALRQMRRDIHFEPVGFELLGERFTLGEVQRLYESVLGVRFDRRNFCKKMLQTGVLKAAEAEASVGEGEGKEWPVGRRGRLYCFDREGYEHMKGGFRLEF
ncbi:MAG: NUDIX hydrolase [Bacteroidales bacterium]|nr:NUDIX hydrolase [Bacteroidales bacterium]